MFVVKNAWKSVTRNKGRNMLIIVIVTIIAAAATIGLSIRQAAATARSSGLDNTTVTAQISLDRGKLISGVMAAAKGRPIDDDAVNALADSVEEELRLGGGGDVPSTRVGLAVLDRLRELDEVAYMRFASVYKNFDGAQDFQREAALLDKSPVS